LCSIVSSSNSSQPVALRKRARLGTIPPWKITRSPMNHAAAGPTSSTIAARRSETLRGRVASQFSTHAQVKK